MTRRLLALAFVAVVACGGLVLHVVDRSVSASAATVDPVPDQVAMTADQLGIFSHAGMQSGASLPANVQATLELLHGKGQKQVPIGTDGVQVVSIESGSPDLSVYAVRFGDGSTPRNGLCLITFWNTEFWKAHPDETGGEGCFVLPAGREFALLNVTDVDVDGNGKPFFGFGFVDPTRVRALDVVLAGGVHVPAAVEPDGHFTVHAEDPSLKVLDMTGYEVTLTDGTKVASR